MAMGLVYIRTCYVVKVYWVGYIIHIYNQIKQVLRRSLFLTLFVSKRLSGKQSKVSLEWSQKIYNKGLIMQ